jgi:ribosomal protein S18 acetylase RimI-like enzyme
MPSNTCSTRIATHHDISQLAILFDDYRVFYDKISDLPAATQFLAQRIALSQSVIYVAQQNQNLVGFVQLYPLFSSTQMKKLWLLNDLFVAHTSRGQGIAQQLINEAKTLCQQTQACGMYLETAQNNHIGNQLYPKMGFVLDTQNNFYHWQNA